MTSRWSRCVVTLLVAGCGPAERIALPAPIPLTQGGTVVPAQGAGIGFDFGDGLLGQEFVRTEMIALGLIGGIGDRVGVAVYQFNETRANDQSGTFVRLKARAGPLLGPETSVAVAFAFGTSAREVSGIQDERLTTFDLAFPAERLLASSADNARQLSAYGGPRIIFEKYDDRLTPEESLDATHVGLLAGVHGRGGNFHLFGELSLMHLPGRTVRGQGFDAGWMVVPALGIAFHVGPAHRWGR